MYKARCKCCQYFQASIDGVPHRGRHSLEVRNTVANALIRDRMPYTSIIRRMQEDYRLTLSLGYIHMCFLWAHEQINMETHWDCVRTNFSGVLCIDEVHDSGRTILFATDPLGDFTSNSTCHLHLYARQITARGYRWAGRLVRKEQKFFVRRFQLMTSRRQRGWPSTCHCTLSLTR